MGFYTLSGGASLQRPLSTEQLVLVVNGVPQQQAPVVGAPVADLRIGDAVRVDLGSTADQPEVWLHYTDGRVSLAAKKLPSASTRGAATAIEVIDFPIDEKERGRASQRDLCGVVAASNVNAFGQSILAIQSGSLSLHYNACRGEEHSGGLSWGWSLEGMHIWLESDCSSAELTLHNGSGSFERWIYSDGAYHACYPDTQLQVQQSCDGTYQVSHSDGTLLKFRSDGQISTQMDESGWIRSFEYAEVSNGRTGQCRVSKVRCSNGRSYHFEYGDRSDNQPTVVRENCPETGPQTRFEYNSSGQLSKLVTASGESQLFYYAVNRKLWKVIDGRGQTTVDFRYLNSGPNAGRVCSELQCGLNLIQYAYAVDFTGCASTIVTETNLGSSKPRNTIIHYNSRQCPVSRRDQSGKLWTFFYEDSRNPYLLTCVLGPEFRPTRAKVAATRTSEVPALDDNSSRVVRRPSRGPRKSQSIEREIKPPVRA